MNMKLLMVKMKAASRLLLLFMLLPALATSAAASNKTTANKIALSPAAVEQSTTKITELTTTFAWGHNIKYSTIILDENITVKGTTLLDITYPKNDDLYAEYTIIGIYTYPFFDKLNAATGEDLANGISVSIVEGGVGSNFTTVRFLSKAIDDVQYILKIFGINV